jgi:hypothetical protein
VPIRNARLPVDFPSQRFIAASGGLDHDKRGNEVLAGLSRVETEWYLANRPQRVVVRPTGKRSDDEQHWFNLHKRYCDARLRVLPGARRRPIKASDRSSAFAVKDGQKERAILGGDRFPEPPGRNERQPREDGIGCETVGLEVGVGEDGRVRLEEHPGAADIGSGVAAGRVEPIDDGGVVRAAEDIVRMEVAMAEAIADGHIDQPVEQPLPQSILELFRTTNMVPEALRERQEAAAADGMDTAVESSERADPLAGVGR